MKGIFVSVKFTDDDHDDDLQIHSFVIVVRNIYSYIGQCKSGDYNNYAGTYVRDNLLAQLWISFCGRLGTVNDREGNSPAACRIHFSLAQYSRVSL